MKFSDHFNLADNVAVELINFIRRNPVFPVNAAADGMDLIAGKKIGPHLKARDITGVAFVCVPITSNLDGIIFIEDGIKYWLVF